MRAAAILILTLTSCGDGSSYIVVTATSGTPLTLSALEISVTNMGATAKSEIKPTAPFNVPPDATFALKLDAKRSGDVMIDVRAIGAAGEVARASGTVRIVGGGTVGITIPLTPCPIHFKTCTNYWSSARIDSNRRSPPRKPEAATTRTM